MVRLTEYKELRENYYEELQKIDNLNECSIFIGFSTARDDLDYSIPLTYVYIGVDDEFDFDDVKCVFIHHMNDIHHTYDVNWEKVGLLRLFIKK